MIIDRRSAPLLGCAVTTALGVINNDAQVEIGELVVVFGAGGVGLNIVQFAALVGALPVIAVDSSTESWKWRASSARAIPLIRRPRPISNADLRDIVGPSGADKVIETTGIKSVIEMAYGLTAAKGACVLIGVPSEPVTIYTLPLHFNKVLTGSEGGQCVPDIDIPRVVKLKAAGRMSFEGTHHP